MERRTAWAVAGVLGLVVLALVAAAVFPLSTSPPDRDAFSIADAEDIDSFELDGEITIDGERFIALEASVKEDGARYSVTDGGDEGLYTESYQPHPEADIYERTEGDKEHIDDIRERVLDDDDEEVVENGTKTLITVTNATVPDRDGTGEVVVEDLMEDTLGSASFFVNSLYSTEYERAEKRDGVRVYEPQSGWREGRNLYRISDTSGEVRVDAETGTLLSADVSVSLTDAGSYAEYLAVRVLADDEVETMETEYEFNGGDADPEPPDWFDDVRAE